MCAAYDDPRGGRSTTVEGLSVGEHENSAQLFDNGAGHRHTILGAAAIAAAAAASSAGTRLPLYSFTEGR